MRTRVDTIPRPDEPVAPKAANDHRDGSASGTWRRRSRSPRPRSDALPAHCGRPDDGQSGSRGRSQRRHETSTTSAVHGVADPVLTTGRRDSLSTARELAPAGHDVAGSADHGVRVHAVQTDTAESVRSISSSRLRQGFSGLLSRSPRSRTSSASPTPHRSRGTSSRSARSARRPRAGIDTAGSRPGASAARISRSTGLRVARDRAVLGARGRVGRASVLARRHSRTPVVVVWVVPAAVHEEELLAEMHLATASLTAPLRRRSSGRSYWSIPMTSAHVAAAWGSVGGIRSPARPHGSIRRPGRCASRRCAPRETVRPTRPPGR